MLKSLILMVVTIAAGLNSPVQVYVSDKQGLRMNATHTLQWQKSSAPRSSSITLHVESTFQRMDGFGGSFLRSGAITLNKLPLFKQSQVLDSLFHPERAGLSVGKVPIGACDYCLLSEAEDTTWWSYREKESDPFSLGPDLAHAGGTIPYIRRARSRMKQHLMLQATMDYPPSWMQKGVLPKITVDPARYNDMAQYFLDYAQHFAKAAGFALEYISLFNEPSDSYTDITVPEIADLLVNHVGVLFRKTHGAPMLTYATQADMNTTWARTPEILRMPGVKDFVDVLFFHAYDCNPWDCAAYPNITCPHFRKYTELMSKMQEEFSEYKLWMTEVCYAQEYGNFPPAPACPTLPIGDFEDSLQWAKMIVNNLRPGGDHSTGVSAWIYWNMILDQNGGPHLTDAAHNDPKVDIQQPLVIVNTDTMEITYTGAYWALAHFGRFVERGMHRVLTLTSKLSVNVYQVAFVDSTGKRVVQLINDSPFANDVVVVDGDEEVLVSLTPVSLTTLVYR